MPAVTLTRALRVRDDLEQFLSFMRLLQDDPKFNIPAERRFNHCQLPYYVERASKVDTQLSADQFIAALDSLSDPQAMAKELSDFNSVCCWKLAASTLSWDQKLPIIEALKGDPKRDLLIKKYQSDAALRKIPTLMFLSHFAIIFFEPLIYFWEMLQKNHFKIDAPFNHSQVTRMCYQFIALLILWDFIALASDNQPEASYKYSDPHGYVEWLQNVNQAIAHAVPVPAIMESSKHETRARSRSPSPR